MQREGGVHGGHGARRRHLDPRQLLVGAQGGELRVEAFTRDLAAGDLEDADDVVEDERAQRGPAEAAIEQNPHRARAGAVDAGQPRANRLLRASGHDRAPRRSRRRRHALLREPVERAPCRAPDAARSGVLGDGRDHGQGRGAVRLGELAQRRVGDRFRRAAEGGDRRGERGPGQRRLEGGAAGGHGLGHAKKGSEGAMRKCTRRA